jgi:hypothetical protein
MLPLFHNLKSRWKIYALIFKKIRPLAMVGWSGKVARSLQVSLQRWFGMNCAVRTAEFS